jgi:hypothetical protein
MLNPLPLRGKCVTNSFLCLSNKWTFISYSIGVWKALQKKQRSINIPSKVRFGSCIRLCGNRAWNSRDRDPLFLKLSIVNIQFVDADIIFYIISIILSATLEESLWAFIQNSLTPTYWLNVLNRQRNLNP